MIILNNTFNFFTKKIFFKLKIIILSRIIRLIIISTFILKFLVPFYFSNFVIF